MKPTIEAIIRTHYFRYAVIPILLIELALLVLYFVINAYVSAQTGERVLQESRANLKQLIQGDAREINLQLQEIGRDLKMLQKRQQALLREPGVVVRRASKADDLFGFSDQGVYHKQQDNGGSAVTVSGIQSLSALNREKVLQTEVFDALFASVADSNEHIMAVYYNTPWHMTRYYPWFEGMQTLLPAKYDINNYNFFYEADPQHNPAREAVWTDAYLDPTGQGWLVSGLIPIYNDDVFEGVTGIDITISSLVSTLMEIDLPYQGAPVLINQQGGILAMSEAAGEALGLQELTDHNYQQSISGDVFKPDEYSLLRHQSPALVEAVQTGLRGEQVSKRLRIGNESYYIYQSRIEQTGWGLLVLVPERAITGPIAELRQLSEQIGYLAIAIIVLFYLVFFFYLRRNAHQIASNLSLPVVRLADRSARLGRELLNDALPEVGVAELDQLSRNFETMSRELNERTRKLVESEIDRRAKEHLANVDFLTGVYNRRAFEQGVQKFMALASQTEVVLIMLDIDYFKAVNDRYGHEYGDKVLVSVAAAIREFLSGQGLVARLGGEEFVVVLSSSLASARSLMEGLRLHIEGLSLLPDAETSVTVSMGLTRVDGDDSVDQALSRADKALYDAKKSGRNRVVVARNDLGEFQMTGSAIR